MRKAKFFHSLKIEKAFLKDELAKCEESLKAVRRRFQQTYRQIQVTISKTDFVRFSRCISECDEKQRGRLQQRNARNLKLLCKKRYGFVSISHDTIINLAEIELTNVQKDVLCRGVHFGIPTTTKREHIMAEFELFYQNVLQVTPVSLSAAAMCKATLESTANEFAASANDLKSFSLGREHMKALRELRRKEDIIISKPDKGRAAVLLKRGDYIHKMLTILENKTKFKELGPVESHDHTMAIELKLVKLLTALKASGQISASEFDSMKPIGSLRPRLYGLPKVHKPGCLLRPILSLTGSPQYAASQWLCRVLSPVVQLYSRRCVKDSFRFVETLKEQPIPEHAHMCSFDVVSLFTNVPLDETVDICADALYRNEDIEPPPLTEKSFRELLLNLTSGVEFSFNNVMYRQIDGVAMGSPLGPVLANIFVGFCESKIPESSWPPFYCRYVDDAFSWFDSRADADNMFALLNNLHPSLKFTCEHEQQGKSPYLDVLVERSHAETLTSVYRKPTFTGLYITWDSFCARKYKINLVRNLVHRAMRICSSSKLQQELDFLKSIFSRNGYPDDVLTRIMAERQTVVSNQYGPERCPVYLLLPWKGMSSSKVEWAVRKAVQSAYGAVKVNVVYSTARAFRIQKDVLPTPHQSHLIYQFECRQCGSRYVGKTLQRLSARVKQHVPLHLLTPEARVLRPRRGRPPRSPKPTNDQGVPDAVVRRESRPRKCKEHVQPTAVKQTTGPALAVASDEYQSSVARHLVENIDCAKCYDDGSFQVLTRGRSKWHLDILEAVFLLTQKPNLCTQKNNLSTLKLFHTTTAHAPV